MNQDVRAREGKAADEETLAILRALAAQARCRGLRQVEATLNEVCAAIEASKGDAGGTHRLH